MDIEEIYQRIENIVEKYQLATKDSFEIESKNSKKLYRSLKNLLDELESEQESEELFDDDEYFSKPSIIEENKTEVKKPVFRKPLTMDDIIGDKEDEIW
jgi:hypothetical protein